MKIFIQDLPVNIISVEDLYDPDQFDILLDGKKHKKLLNFNSFAGNVMVRNVCSDTVDDFLVFLKQNRLKSLEGIVFAVRDYRKVINKVKSEYTIIKAAGGLVLKSGKALMIYRLKTWDLPKGKLEKGEKPKACALREVEEECNIKVKLGKKLCHTWHTYKRNGDKILKKTYWYTMYCTDDSKMKPLKVENIEQVRWMDETEIEKALSGAYLSIRDVFKKYYAQF